MLAEQAGWRDHTFNWFDKHTNKIHKCVEKNDRKVVFEKSTERQRDQEKRMGRGGSE